ncbi:hypothetical protein ACSAZL_05820 [Methanosarcina sp. T3]|uniref:hypothetical protein n=1 Tax=Methanosarcina sp. T3 TaxID=3439062 RepID=UPI003F86DC76
MLINGHHCAKTVLKKVSKIEKNGDFPSRKEEEITALEKLPEYLRYIKISCS